MKRLLVLDSNSIINRAFYGIRTLNAPDGTPTNAIYGFINILIKLIGDHDPDCIMAAFDLKAPTFRHKLYSQYKATRHAMPEELAAQMPIMKEILSLMNIPILQIEGYEADDIIGTVSRVCGEKGIKCFIATGDRDDLQLVGENTTVVLASTKLGRSVTELYDAEKVKAEYGVTSSEFVELKALMGDTSDNIPGVKGIGKKTAAKLIGGYSTLEGVYEHIEELPVSQKIKDSLVAERETAFLSRTLSAIDTRVPIEVDTDGAGYNREAPEYAPGLYPLLMRLGLRTSIERLGVVPSSDDSGQATTSFFEGKTIERTADAENFAAITRSLGSPIALSLTVSGGLVAEAGVSDGTRAVCSDNIPADELTAALAPILADAAVKKYVSGIKDAMTALSGTAKINGVARDCAIAAYLCEPTGAFDTESLAIKYLGVVPDGEQNAQLSLFDEEASSDAAGKEAHIIFALCESLAQKIEDEGRHALYCDVEMPLIEVLAQMQTLGFTIDRGAISAFGQMLSERADELETRIRSAAGEDFNINSPKQLGQILFDKLKLPGGKKTAKGYSTKAEILEKLKDSYPIVADVLEYRKYRKLKSTYCDSLAALADPVTNRIHTVFHQTGTVTGRLSSSDPNLQNIPTRTEIGRELRKMFVAKDGCVLVDADYSQIELRVLAHLSGDEEMIKAFRSGMDIHAVTASKILGVPIEELTKEQRASAKTINFGIVYGMSEYTLSRDLGISYAEAKRYMNGYFNKYSGVRRYMDKVKEDAKRSGCVTTMMNRIRRIPEIASSNAQLRGYGERAAMNTPVQGSAADIIKLAMVRVYDRLKGEGLESRLILQVHDELIVEAPENEAERVCDILKTEMENAVRLDVPLVVEPGVGKSWYEAKS